MDQVDNSIKYVFHGFGVADLIFQIVFAVYTFSSFNCVSTGGIKKEKERERESKGRGWEKRTSCHTVSSQEWFQP